MSETRTALVGELDLLVSVTPPGPGFIQVPRARSAEPSKVAGLVADTGATRALVFSPLAGETEAIEAAGVGARTWDRVRFPVADTLLADTQRRSRGKRVFFHGPTNARRDRFLQPVKHRFDVLHLVAGARRERLVGLIDQCAIAIDLAPEKSLRLVDRLGPATARGLIVFSEAAVNEPRIDEDEGIGLFSTPQQLELLISDALDDPEAFRAVRERGRMRAEDLRASTLLPEFLDPTVI